MMPAVGIDMTVPNAVPKNCVNKSDYFQTANVEHLASIANGGNA